MNILETLRCTGEVEVNPTTVEVQSEGTVAVAAPAAAAPAPAAGGAGGKQTKKSKGASTLTIPDPVSNTHPVTSPPPRHNRGVCVCERITAV